MSTKSGANKGLDRCTQKSDTISNIVCPYRTSIIHRLWFSKSLDVVTVTTFTKFSDKCFYRRVQNDVSFPSCGQITAAVMRVFPNQSAVCL